MRAGAPWHVCVLIPARNEEELLPRCLESVFSATNALNGAATVEIVVVADSSNDRTAEIATSLLKQQGTVLKTTAGSVGTARSLAARFVLGRHSGPLVRTWLANTDADCMVPSTWLVDQLRLAEQGVQAIAGTVSVDNFNDHGPEVADRFRRSYLIGANGSHSHVHGANFGLRADVYLRSGGWTDLATAEDHDLWRRLLDTKTFTRSTNRIEVVTSGRKLGRAPHGFAAALAAHNEVPK